jgi:membrane-associated phospholipid phosphatase
MTKRPFLIAASLFVLAMILLPLDRVFAELFTSDAVPGEIQAILNRAETFGHGYGVLLIIVTIWILTRCEFRQLTPLIICSFGAGLLADLIKIGIGRTRPGALPADFAGSTFTGLMPFWGSESFHQAFDHANQSFPSAHTATAFGFAVCLAVMYPRAGRWFFTLATLVALQRLVSGAHYVSDVLVGVAVGLAFANLALRYFAALDQDAMGAEAPTVSVSPARHELGRAA